MIVQTAAEGQPHFIITQIAHARASGEFAKHFGNAQFDKLAPNAPMIYVVEHHDDGWEAIDGEPKFDANTGLPYHLTQTPTALLIATGNTSPQKNQAHHPYAGIISSMHTWGLYHGRYGLSDKIYIDMIDETLRPDVDAMLDQELARQTTLKAALQDQPEMVAYLEDEVLFHNYKLLQFFDTLALYIQTQPFAALTETEFQNVPERVGEDTTIHAKPLDNHTVQLRPWCFDVETLTVSTSGHYMHAQSSPPDDLGALLYGLPSAKQTVHFVS